MVVLEKMYNFSAVGILFSTTVDVAMNFLAAMLAFMTKHDFTYFVMFRLVPTGIDLNGGFGKAYRLRADEL